VPVPPGSKSYVPGFSTSQWLIICDLLSHSATFPLIGSGS
jgi:hypothetical protein